ncbi:MAG: DUF3052 family protein [Chloroflexi bacterium]|nr:DUF3052 family protein [Chloroflexota bacterium]
MAQANKTARQAEREYSHRDVVDKLGIKPGSAVAFAAAPRQIDPALRERALIRAGRDAADDDEAVDVVLVGADPSTDVVAVLVAWRSRIDPAGGIWLLTPKRGQPGYVDQRELIEAGPAAGVVDNKICSVDEHTSALRFVIRKTDRIYS